MCVLGIKNHQAGCRESHKDAPEVMVNIVSTLGDSVSSIEGLELGLNEGVRETFVDISASFGPENTSLGAGRHINREYSKFL